MARLEDIRSRLVGVDEEDFSSEAMVGIFGQPSVGKTVVALQLAQELAAGEPILHIDTSDNLISADNNELRPLLGNVKHFVVENAGDIAVVSDALYQRKPGFEDFAVVVVDEASSIYHDTLEAYTREKDGLRPDEPLGDIEGKYYGAVASMMASWIKTLKRTEGLHVILVNHERRTVTQANGENSKQTVMSPEFSPTGLIEMQKLLHVHARLTTKITTTKGKPVYTRELQSWPTPTVAAKCKISTVPLYATPEEWVDALVAYYYPDE